MQGMDGQNDALLGRGQQVGHAKPLQTKSTDNPLGLTLN